MSCHDFNTKTKITGNICVEAGYIFLFAGCNSMLAGFYLFVIRKIKRNKRQALPACDMTLKVPHEGTSAFLCSSDIRLSPGQPFHTQGGGIVSIDSQTRMVEIPTAPALQPAPCRTSAFSPTFHLCDFVKDAKPL